MTIEVGGRPKSRVIFQQKDDAFRHSLKDGHFSPLSGIDMEVVRLTTDIPGHHPIDVYP